MVSKETEYNRFIQRKRDLESTTNDEEVRLDLEVEEEWKQLHEPSAGRIEVAMNQRAQQICKGLTMYE